MKIEALFLHNGQSETTLLNNLNVFPLATAKAATYIHVFAKKGVLGQHGSYTFPMRTCPCITNRYVVFNALGISAGKKTALENMGWKVSP